MTFKVGDVVKRTKCGSGYMATGTIDRVVEVSNIIKLQGHGGVWHSTNFEIVDSNLYERQKLSDAIDLLAKHNVRALSAGANPNYAKSFPNGAYKSLPKEEMLDYLFPKESPAQKKLKELEEKQRAIADEIAKVREEMSDEN